MRYVKDEGWREERSEATKPLLIPHDSLARRCRFFVANTPSSQFVLPTAPTQPVTLNGGMPMPSWYDIEGLSERTNENCNGIVESQRTVERIMEGEAAAGLPYSRMVLSGFSQGAALSLFTGLQLPDDKKIAGVLAMSGYLAGSKQFKLSPAGKTTPVLHCHGTADPMVTFSMAQKTETLLKEGGVENYELKPYAGMQHTVLPEELSDALAFLNKVLPPDDTCAVKPKSVDEMR